MKELLERLMRRKVRVYIFPTRMGGYLIGLIGLMFLLSIGYSNNLLLIFTIVLFGLNLIWLVNSHFHLARLGLGQVSVEDGHAGAPTSVTVRWKRWPRGEHRWDLWLIGEELRSGIRLFSEEEGRLTGELSLPARGVFHWRHLLVKTDRPFGLYQTWIYFPVDVTAHAYPALQKEGTLPSPEIQDREGSLTGEKKGDEGLRGLSLYQGEGSRRISWKHYAKSGELLVKEGEELRTQLVRIPFRLPESRERREAELSRLATLLVQCHREDVPFIFEAPRPLGPGSHLELLKDCLRELARC